MGKRFAHLLSGLLLLTVAGFFILRTANEWKTVWRREVLATVHEIEGSSSDKTNQDSDDITDAAKLQLYGVLHHSDGAAPARDDAAPRQPSAPGAFDHVNPAPAGAPRHFLHRRFSVKGYRRFAFEIPAYATHPRVRGAFQSFAGSTGAAARVEAAVDVLLLNEQEFSDFVRRGPGTATFSMEDSDGGVIDWVLTPTLRDPQKYYLVFHNVSRRPQANLVDADFTVSFE
jgi:hypothetical protein